jgi:hypothetical protein
MYQGTKKLSTVLLACLALCACAAQTPIETGGYVLGSKATAPQGPSCYAVPFSSQPCAAQFLRPGTVRSSSRNLVIGRPWAGPLIADAIQGALVPLR